MCIRDSFEGEFLTFTFLVSFTFCNIITILFPEAVELTTTQDERIEMEHPALLFFKPLYVVISPPTILEVVVGFVLQGAERIATTIPHKLLHQVGIVIQLRIGDDRVRVAHEYPLTLGIDAVDERPQPTPRIRRDG